MKQTCLILTLAGVLFAANEPATFTGVITDTMCGRTHGMMKAPSDEVCVKTCVKGSGEYALFNGKNVLKLSDQKLPAKFAAQRVKVIGAYDAGMPMHNSMANRVSYVIAPDGKIIYEYTSLSPEKHVENTLKAVKDWAETHKQ